MGELAEHESTRKKYHKILQIILKHEQRNMRHSLT